LVYTIVRHLQISVLDCEIGQHRVNHEAGDSDTNAENIDVAHVLKEGLSSHVKARVKH
jgi:hypothetical protein